ncbi:MAG: NIPSNAP family protein [Pseudomonadota bacterium]
MINQLRTYEIFERNAEAFHARFRDDAVRIFAAYGFRILAMWELHEGNRLLFSYLLSWHDEEEMRERWSAFMADEEWAEIKRVTAIEHGALVGAIEDRVLHPCPYSAAIEARP